MYKQYDAPQGAPFKELLRERAIIRTEFARNKAARKNLPMIGAIKFGMMNFGSPTVKPMDISRTARTLPGNGVKDSLLPPN